jgi:putative transposase
VKDTFFVVCDGLKGLPEVAGNVWPLAIVQTCIIHYPDTVVMPIRGWEALAGGVTVPAISA